MVAWGSGVGRAWVWSAVPVIVTPSRLETLCGRVPGRGWRRAARPPTARSVTFCLRRHSAAREPPPDARPRERGLTKPGAGALKRKRRPAESRRKSATPTQHFPNDSAWPHGPSDLRRRCNPIHRPRASWRRCSCKPLTLVSKSRPPRCRRASHKRGYAARPSYGGHGRPPRRSAR